MIRFARFVLGPSVAAVVSLPLAALPARSQGVTTGAVLGRMKDNSGDPVAGVTLTLTNTSTGGRFAGTSRDDGRTAVENVAVAGPTVLEPRRIGVSRAPVQGSAVL